MVSVEQNSWDNKVSICNSSRKIIVSYSQYLWLPQQFLPICIDTHEAFVSGWHLSEYAGDMVRWVVECTASKCSQDHSTMVMQRSHCQDSINLAVVGISPSVLQVDAMAACTLLHLIPTLPLVPCADMPCPYKMQNAQCKTDGSWVMANLTYTILSVLFLQLQALHDYLPGALQNLELYVNGMGKSNQMSAPTNRIVHATLTRYLYHYSMLCIAGLVWLPLPWMPPLPEFQMDSPLGGRMVSAVSEIMPTTLWWKEYPIFRPSEHNHIRGVDSPSIR